MSHAYVLQIASRTPIEGLDPPGIGRGATQARHAR